MACLWVGVLSLWALAGLRPPPALPSEAPAAAFSADRAMRHVRAMARHPRPAGSTEHARVRDYLLQELRSLGLRPEVQRTVGVLPDQPGAGGVENVLVRLPGTSSHGALVLVAHYDSVMEGPGAADNASGAAALLEVVRVLASGTPPGNDLIVLFSDTEEYGLLGARAFMAEHPWRQDAKVVVNLDMGRTGLVAPIRTTLEGGWLMDAFARAVPRPIATSISNELLPLIGLEDDTLAFAATGVPGYWLGPVFFYPEYHQPGDEASRVDARGVQHLGEQALALARHFGHSELRAPEPRDALWFNVSGWLVRYPRSAAIPLALGSGGLFVGVWWLGVRKKRVTWAGPAWASLGFLAALLVAAVLAHGVVRGLHALQPPAAVLFPTAHGPGDVPEVFGVLALSAAVVMALQGWLRQRQSAADVALGAMLPWAGLALLSAVAAPSASHLFVWPLLFLMLAWGGVFLKSRGQQLLSTPGRLAVFGLAVIPLMLLWVAHLALLFLGSGLSFPWALALLMGLLAGALSSHFGWEAPRRWWAGPAGLLGVGLVLLGAGLITSLRVPRTPSYLVQYHLNTDNGRAIWHVATTESDSWRARLTRRMVSLPASELFSFGTGEARGLSAPAVSVALPRLRVLEDRREGEDRHLRARFVPGPETVMQLLVVGPGTEVLAISVEGKPLSLAEQPEGWRILAELVAPPPEGFELDLRVRTPGPLQVTLHETRLGLPVPPEGAPPGQEVGPGSPGCLTNVVRTFTVPAPGRGPARGRHP